jgi:CelD/BcsL family acetyltransferase involved in cellulose biosynthesis
MSWSLSPVSAFPEFAPRWEQLHRAARTPPILSSSFVAPLLAEFAGSGQLLASYSKHGHVSAMAVLTRSGRGAWSTFQPAQAPVGLWLQEAGADTALLLDELLQALPGCALVLGLTQCDPLFAPRPPDGARQHSMDYIDTARITVTGSFDDFWNGRGKNLRTNLKKQRARLDKDGVALSLDTIRAPADVAAAIADYGRLEGGGWKAQDGTAIDADNAQGRFYRAMLTAFCGQGAGCIYRYRFGDRVVAMDLCIENDDCIVVLKTSYDESVPSAFSPAFLMREEICRRLFDAGRFARIEFYGKVMPWHLRWTDEMRTLYHLNRYRWAPLKALHLRLQRRGHRP